VSEPYQGITEKENNVYVVFKGNIPGPAEENGAEAES
jgi:hypothetical protein